MGVKVNDKTPKFLIRNLYGKLYKPLNKYSTRSSHIIVYYKFKLSLGFGMVKILRS